MYIIGISCFYHDSAACLMKDGEIKFAIQEERLTRIKNESRFPILAIKKCLESERISFDQVAHIIYYEKPFLKFERIIESYLIFSNTSLSFFLKSVLIWVKKRLFLKKEIFRVLNEHDLSINGKFSIKFCEHHMSHAAASFLFSPFEEALILNVDGVGEWATTSIMIGKGKKITKKKEIFFPHSLGLFYSSITSFLGFKVNGDEYKVMGLASYGRPIFKQKIYDNLIDVKADGSFKLNLKYFNFGSLNRMYAQSLQNLFDCSPRLSSDPMTQIHADIANSIQVVLEETLVKVVDFMVDEYNIKNLCMSGGVALNCVANGQILRESKADKIWIQPASGDAGAALGAAAHYYTTLSDVSRSIRAFNPFLGPSYLFDPKDHNLEEFSISTFDNFDELIDQTTDLIIKGEAIGWFQDRMEFGPRALGNRSILADPRNVDMISNLNMRIKFRESFRPFAPAVLHEYAHDYFEFIHESPFMLFVDQIKANHRITPKQRFSGFAKINEVRSTIPAVTHVDHSARIQTVTQEFNLKFYQLIKSFFEKTGVPMLINTSFNLKDEPIVCNPSDAIECMRKTNLNYLVINSNLIRRRDKK